MDILMIGITPPIEGGSQRHIYEISSKINCQVLTQKGSICKNKIELPVLDNNQLLLNLTPLAILLKIRYKVVITVHGITGFKFYESKLLWFFFKQGLKLADLIISVSVNDKMLLDKEFSNVIYISNGVDLELYRNINPEIKKQITFVGRIHEQKGVVYLLEAFTLLTKQNPDFELNIIGKINPLASSLKNQFSNPKIIWKGFILDRKILFKEIASSYALVYPSLWEALPWPALLEGLASGRPIVASDLQGMRKVFNNKKNILLCTPGNSKELAEKIQLLLKNKNMAEKVGKAGKNLSLRFDWQEIARKINSEYGKL
ncbi:MAG: glycosyltransferase [Candidatus Pacearchaeota archaeon]|nr:glycosyltransferase [Candidatus Pacearchaeota archaeon]